MNIGPFEWWNGGNGFWILQLSHNGDLPWWTFSTEDAALTWLREGLEEALAAVEGGAK